MKRKTLIFSTAVAIVLAGSLGKKNYDNSRVKRIRNEATISILEELADKNYDGELDGTEKDIQYLLITGEPRRADSPEPTESQVEAYLNSQGYYFDKKSETYVKRKIN
jgi:hypothetical protein